MLSNLQKSWKRRDSLNGTRRRIITAIPSFEPEYGKFVLENMVVQAGARVIYDATCMDAEMDGCNIKRVLFHTKGGVMAVSARLYIDSTGDADTGGNDRCAL